MEHTIYVLLMNEGTDCWRPVQSYLIDGLFYKIADFQVPEDEEWEFQPGTMVQCENKVFHDGTTGLAAMEQIQTIDDLKLQDVISNKVWRHWAKKSIAYVVPVKINEIKEYEDSNYIVQTNFFLNNGTKQIGFCSPQDTSGLDYIQPVITTENYQISFWKDNGWSEDEKLDELDKLKLNPSEVFPIRYETTIICDSETHQGIIKDFNVGE